MKMFLSVFLAILAAAAVLAWIAFAVSQSNATAARARALEEMSWAQRPIGAAAGCLPDLPAEVRAYRACAVRLTDKGDEWEAPAGTVFTVKEDARDDWSATVGGKPCLVRKIDAVRVAP